MVFGDVCRERTRYLCSVTFDEIDTLKVSPAMPYHDPRRHTRFPKGFLKDGRPEPVWDSRMRARAGRPGWFVPAADVLDHLHVRPGGNRGRAIRRSERMRLSRRWALERLRDRRRAARRRRA